MFTSLRRSDIRDLLNNHQNIFNTRSTGRSYDDLSDITWNWWRNKLCISFSKPRDFGNGPDLVCAIDPQNSWLVKSTNKNTKLHISFSSTYFHHDAWWFIIIIEWNTTPLVKGRSRREHNSHMPTTAVTAQQHVGLGYKTSSGHASHTWQLTQQAACPSFTRNQWLE